MLRNESSILEPFLDQIDTFFDHATFLDHESTDDSVETVRDRGSSAIELHKLKAPGYPQAAVATLFARRILKQSEPDFLFLLDCDEFLPFSDRSELESFLRGFKSFDALSLRWLNICPSRLDGGNIFSAPFLRAPEPSETITKVVLSNRLASRDDWTVSQGYHLLLPQNGAALRVADVEDRQVYHVPIQSRTQFHFKIAAGARRLQQEAVNLRLHQGWHWVELARDLGFRQMSDDALTDIALCYPDKPPPRPAPRAKLDFTFPYIRSLYQETAGSQSGQIIGLLRQFAHPEEAHQPGSFTVTDATGAVLFSSGGPIVPEGTAHPAPRLPLDLFNGTLAEHYSTLVEPLFSLPAKLPPTAWAGHVPFMFSLFHTLRPETYVELGVHNGASLIAAATAAATYQVPTALVGVDSWQGDAHAGVYEGESIYQDLKTYLSATFPNARLERCFFSEAIPKFATGSVDILHIDGLHTYDAVKEDFTSWFDRVSPTGVILFHDISVFERGFGVHLLWEELKERFLTLEFHHSFGLGVVLLAPEDERIKPLAALARDKQAMRAYRSLVADVARVLPERMDAYGQRGTISDEANGAAARLAAVEAELDTARRTLSAVYSSTSWRVSAPVRMLRRALGT
ncbi:MAG: class I SAM-dependent methyltransferase [Rhodopila sp.]|nr:class I SAM-dependent methyltransferase [Rhodopila sp.]